MHLGIITECMTLGSIVGGWVRAGGTVLPGYVGAMFIAVIFRNLNDKFNFYKARFLYNRFNWRYFFKYFLIHGPYDIKVMGIS